MKPLPPGPDLDQLVAERVMGWHRVDETEGVRAWRPPSLERGRPARMAYGVPRFSTEISAAWAVAERSQLAILPHVEAGEVHWYATDVQNVVFGDSVTVIEEDHGGISGETPAYAICLAALVASGLDLD